MSLLDVPVLEQQLLGLVWRGSKIDHQPGEHDDYANAVAGVVRQLLGRDDAREREVRAFAFSVGAGVPLFGESYRADSDDTPVP